MACLLALDSVASFEYNSELIVVHWLFLVHSEHYILTFQASLHFCIGLFCSLWEFVVFLALCYLSFIFIFLSVGFTSLSSFILRFCFSEALFPISRTRLSLLWILGLVLVIWLSLLLIFMFLPLGRSLYCPLWFLISFLRWTILSIFIMVSEIILYLECIYAPFALSVRHSPGVHGMGLWLLLVSL